MGIFNVFKTEYTKRWDTAWYGFGYNKCVFRNNVGYPGITYFLNSYRKAPIRISYFRCFGIWKDVPKHVPSLYFSGSQVDPYASWFFRFGRVFVGGVTPRTFIAAHKRFQRWQWLQEAKRTGEGLCPACGKGLIMCQSGYTGEYFDMCDNPRCHHVFQSYFNKREVE